MKTKRTNSLILRSSMLAIIACAISSCASFEHPLARHDMDGDGAISDPEYRQNHMQYNMASRQRDDEYSRARLMTAHASNAGDFIGQADRITHLLGNFGN